MLRDYLFSVIMPTFNSELFVEESILSVLNQTDSRFELLIVDDLSTDSTLDKVYALQEKDSRIRVIALEVNSGAAVARNKGIEESKGRYITFLDSDDIWAPTKLEKQLAFMEAGGYAFSFTAYGKVNENGESIGSVGVPDKVCYQDLLKVCSVGCLTAMYDASVLGKMYMPLIRKRQDLGLWLRILKKIEFAYGLDEELAFYRVREGSISSNKRIAAQFTWKLYREHEKLNIISSSYYFLHYSINGVLRTKFPKLARWLGVLK